MVKTVSQSPSHVWLFATPWTAAHQASLSFTVSLVSRWCHPTISSSCHPFSPCLQSLPALESSSESALRIRWPEYWSFSFSISPSSEYSRLISFRIDCVILKSKGFSRIFSSTTAWKHQFLVLSFLFSPTLTSIHDYWKNYGFDYMNLCWQSDVSAF